MGIRLRPLTIEVSNPPKGGLKGPPPLEPESLMVIRRAGGLKGYRERQLLTFPDIRRTGG